MAPGFVWLTRSSCGAVAPSLLTAKHPEALIYGRRIRVVGASKWGRALPGGGQWSSLEPAAAGGCRPRRPATPPHNPQGILRIRRIREVQFMLPEFVDRMRGSKWQSALPTGSKWNRALPGSKWVQV